MRAKKPLLIVVLTLVLVAVALILPAAASGKQAPHNWATWGQNVKAEWPFPWQATFSVHVQQHGTKVVGREVMNWISDVIPPYTPPKGHHRTTHVVDSKFVDGVATIIFRFDTQAMGWPDVYDDYVYHVWVLTDNPGRRMDHVDLYTQMRDKNDGPPDINERATWGTWLLQSINVHGVRVVSQ